MPATFAACLQELKRKQLDGEAAEEAASKQARKDEAKEKVSARALAADTQPCPRTLPRQQPYIAASR